MPFQKRHLKGSQKEAWTMSQNASDQGFMF